MAGASLRRIGSEPATDPLGSCDDAVREAFPMLETPAPVYDTADLREALAKHAALGDRLDKWAADRKARREQESLQAALGPATPQI